MNFTDFKTDFVATGKIGFAISDFFCIFARFSALTSFIDVGRGSDLLRGLTENFR